MKEKKWIFLLFGVLILVTAALTVIHLTTREAVPEGAILVRQDSKERYVSLNELSLIRITGTIVNGKGEERRIDAPGIELSDLADAVFSKVTVTSDDEYSATVEAGEIGNANLIMNEDGSVQLIVFGDANSKRAVRNVARIEFE
ncbi:MAG: hypothetical protein IJ719_06285 [Clostridia bacterium]|nr:hypothetical protein [Clostridia bacterium]